MKHGILRIMDSNVLVRVIVMVTPFMMATFVQADNPIAQTIYTTDPAPMVYNGVCYVYTGHDEDVLVDNFFTMDDWRCYSSTDMQNWTDLGSPLSYTDFSWASGDAWAGQCIYRNGNFYFYVPMGRKAGGKAIGVAVATNPAGSFSDALGYPLVGDDGSYGDIDPTVFIDDDGQAYLYWGNPYLHYVKLNEDMISYSGSVVDVPLTPESFGVRSDTDRPSQYEEGPWFYKRNDLYYMVFAAGPISEHISYSTSPNPTGPWTFGGIIMPTQGSSFTNHPGVCDYQGNSYFFYHNGALPGGGGFHRSVCVEQFNYNADGAFPTINMTTTGPPQIDTLNPYIRTEAETICWESGIETEVCSEGGMNVTSISDGDWIRVRGVDFLTGANSFEASVAGISSGASIELRLDSIDGTLVGTCAVPNTGSDQIWTTAVCTVSGASGVHDLYLRFQGSAGGDLFNLDWWQFKTDSLVLTNVTLDSSTIYQTIEGLGGAICFYNGWFTAHPYKQEIFDYAFSGLKISMLRLGNWWRGTDGQDTATYEIVDAAKQRLGGDIPILMSSWSPPAYLKSNGEVANGGTLIQVDGEYDYAGFSDYWYDSLQDYSTHGITPTWIGIQNEPDWTADYDSCRFDPTEDQYASFALAQDAVYNRLQSLASPPKLLGPECVGLYGNAAGLQNYMAYMNPDTFYGIAHHLYGGSTDGTPDGYNSAFTTVLNSSNTLFPGKPRFMTEFGDIKGLIPCANLFHNSLVVEQVSGYNHWCLIWPGDIGLVEIENPWGSGSWVNPKGYWLNPSYWAMKHYSYFIESGYKRVQATSSDSDVLVSSYLSPDNKRLVTVFINRNTTDPIYVTLNTGSLQYDQSSIYQTEGENHFVSLGSVIGSQLMLPASSVTTVVLNRNAPVPTGLMATILSDTQINLTWTASAGVSSYNIKRSTASGGPYTTISTDIPRAAFGDTSVAPGTTYYYVVSANTTEGESFNSNEATAVSLHAYLKFNETGGTSAADSTGNGWTGTLNNGAVWTIGKSANAVGLDGNDDYVNLPTGVVDGLTDITISTWVYLNSASTWSRIFDFGNDTDVYMFLTPNNGATGAVRFAITTNSNGGEDVISGTGALPTGIWTHVAVTLGGGTGILYVDGDEVGRNSLITLIPDSLGATTNNLIGYSQWTWDPYLDGRMDDFRIYPTALSSDQIGTLYASQIPIAIPSTPTGLSAAATSGNRIDLTWNAAAGATNYNVNRSTNDGGPYTLVASVGGTNYHDTGLSELTTYYYVVSAVNSEGESVDSPQADAMTQSAPPAVPSGLTATVGDGWVTLNWDANTEGDLAGYNVYRSTISGSGYILQNGSLLSNPNFTDNNVTNYTTYYYVVTAVDTYTYESAYSDEVEAMPDDGSIVQLSAVDFEGGFGDWVNITGQDTQDWLRDSGGTLTPNTGPDSGANGSTWYIYLETSPGGAYTAGDTAILQSPVIPGYKRTLTFYYHMYGSQIGTLNVDVYDGTWHDAVWSLSGQQQSSGSDEYTEAIVDLTGYTGPIQIRFRAVAAGGSSGDIAIDDIKVTGGLLYGDMNGDNIVNAGDLPEFADKWLQEDCGLDLDGDCVITLYEFTKFANNWLDDSFQ